MGDDEVERLRRRAFSRDGTAEDLRLLAELEAARDAERVAAVASPSADEPDAPEPEAETDLAPDHEPEPDREPEVTPEPPAAARPGIRPRLQLAIAAAAGLLVGVVLTATLLSVPAADSDESAADDSGVGTSPAAADGRVPALDVFDRAATADDDPAGLRIPLEELLPRSFESPELRRLGVVEGVAAYAVRGTVFYRQPHVCLLAQTDETSSIACASLEDFVDRGWRLRIGHLDVLWNPDGMRRWIGVHLPGTPA